MKNLKKHEDFHCQQSISDVWSKFVKWQLDLNKMDSALNSFWNGHYGPFTTCEYELKAEKVDIHFSRLFLFIIIYYHYYFNVVLVSGLLLFDFVSPVHINIIAAIVYT